MSDWTKKETLNEMKQYTEDMLVNYPKFAKDKLAMTNIPIKAELPTSKDRLAIMAWINTNMTESQMAYAGF